MVKRNLAGFDVWLRQRKPLFSTGLFKSADLCPPGFLPPPQPDRGQSAPLGAPLGSREQPQTQPLNKVSDAQGVAQTTHVTAKNGGSREVPIGRRYERGNLGSPETLPADLLSRHVAIIAGSGSGKTVLLRRIVEEAALLGIPAIVLDTNNDLARLGDKWPN